MSRKILFVDDDSNLLAAMKRRLRKLFEIEVAVGPEMGLEMIRQQGPFAVVIADMRMPNMDGIEFLRHVKQQSPDTVRMMLTGNADLQTAINAVNEGNIFRFLTKPCAETVLSNAINAGLEQYSLIVAEQELLEKTLMGSIKVLSDVLSLINPVAFSQAARIRNYVRHIIAEINPPNSWQFEVAALLSQVGCVTLPFEILDKVYNQKPLTDDEERMFAAHPATGQRLLGNIPRLESIAQMIAAQQRPYRIFPPHERMNAEAQTIALGAQMLKVALGFDQQLISGLPPQQALFDLRNQPEEYNPELVNTLESFRLTREGHVLRLVRIKELNTHMVADQDIRARNGVLLLARGQEITFPVIQRLRNFYRHTEIVEPVQVLVTREG